SVVLHIRSFIARDPTRLINTMLWVGIGILPLWGAAAAFYHPGGKTVRYAALPRQLRWPGYVLFGYFLLNMFFLFWFLEGGYTAVYDGECFLVFHGSAPPRPISRAEFLYYESFKARFLSTFEMVAFYLPLVQFWSFHKASEPEIRTDSPVR